MDFPIADLMDEDACYAKLVHWLHPRGLACPRCGACDDLGVHRRHHDPILDLRCKACRRVFNADFRRGKLTHSSRCKIAVLLRSGVCSC